MWCDFICDFCSNLDLRRMENHIETEKKALWFNRRNDYDFKNGKQMEVHFSLLFHLVYLFNDVLCSHFCTS